SLGISRTAGADKSITSVRTKGESLCCSGHAVGYRMPALKRGRTRQLGVGHPGNMISSQTFFLPAGTAELTISPRKAGCCLWYELRLFECLCSVAWDYLSFPLGGEALASPSSPNCCARLP